MIKYKPFLHKIEVADYFVNKLAANKWLASVLAVTPSHSYEFFSDRNDDQRIYFQDDPFGNHEDLDLIDLHPTAEAEIETDDSIIIASCFAQHNYISLAVESKEEFLKSFEIRIYYDDALQLESILYLTIEYQNVISTENYLEFMTHLLDLRVKVFWQEALVLGEQVTNCNVFKGHPLMEMNWSK